MERGGGGREKMERREKQSEGEAWGTKSGKEGGGIRKGWNQGDQRRRGR